MKFTPLLVLAFASLLAACDNPGPSAQVRAPAQISGILPFGEEAEPEVPVACHLFIVSPTSRSGTRLTGATLGAGRRERLPVDSTGRPPRVAKCVRPLRRRRTWSSSTTL